MRMTHASMIIMAIVYLLLISSCLLQWSSGTAFNPVVYDTKAPLSSQCGQSDPFEDDQQLMEALKMAQQTTTPYRSLNNSLHTLDMQASLAQQKVLSQLLTLLDQLELETFYSLSTLLVSSSMQQMTHSDMWQWWGLV